MTDVQSFSCRCCGECCRTDMHVYLNPEDLVLISRGINAINADCGDFSDLGPVNNTVQLFEKSIIIIDYERNNAPLPRLRFSRGISACCPFLENRVSDKGELHGLCRLHPEFKPLVCWLAPRFRTVDLDEETEAWGFKPPVPGCPGVDSGESRLSAPDPDLSKRLEAEKKFFKTLTKMLDSKTANDVIIKELYSIDIF